MNIKHIVYTFFFVALMGVISEKSEAIKIINTSVETFFVECNVKYFYDGQVIGQQNDIYLLFPLLTKDINIMAGANNVVEVLLKIPYWVQGKRSFVEIYSTVIFNSKNDEKIKISSSDQATQTGIVAELFLTN